MVFLQERLMKTVSWVSEHLRQSIYRLGTQKINLAGYKSMWLYFLVLRPLFSGATSEKLAPTWFLPIIVSWPMRALCLNLNCIIQICFHVDILLSFFFPEKYCAILIYRFHFLNFRFVFLYYFLDYVVPFASLYANIFDSLYLAHCVGDLYLVH